MCVFDITLGLASAGIVFMVIEGNVEPSSFLVVVCVNVIAALLGIFSLVTVLKPILPGVRSRAIMFYMIWKIIEVFICPFLDAIAMWQSTLFKSHPKSVEDDEVSKPEEINQELYD